MCIIGVQASCIKTYVCRTPPMVVYDATTDHWVAWNYTPPVSRHVFPQDMLGLGLYCKMSSWYELYISVKWCWKVNVCMKRRSSRCASSIHGFAGHYATHNSVLHVPCDDHIWPNCVTFKLNICPHTMFTHGCFMPNQHHQYGFGPRPIDWW